MKVALPSMGTIGLIQATVADSYGIDRRHMRSPRRYRSVAWPRQIAMYLSYELTNFGTPRIGFYFGNRDHATVIHAIRAVEKRMAEDALYRADVEALKEALS